MNRLANRLFAKLASLFSALFPRRRGLYYIHGCEVLPPPLSKPEEAELIRRLAAGQTEVRQALIERNEQVLRTLRRLSGDEQQTVRLGTDILHKCRRGQPRQ